MYILIRIYVHTCIHIFTYEQWLDDWQSRVSHALYCEERERGRIHELKNMREDMHSLELQCSSMRAKNSLRERETLAVEEERARERASEEEREKEREIENERASERAREREEVRMRQLDLCVRRERERERERDLCVELFGEISDTQDDLTEFTLLLSLVYDAQQVP